MAQKKTYSYPEYLKKWRAENKARIKEYAHKRYLEHREEAVQYALKTNKENPERHRLSSKIYAANSRYPGKITAKQFEEIVTRLGPTCYWCHKPGLSGRDLTLEHLQPINDPKYIVIACFECNAAKIPTRGPRKTDAEKRAHRNAYSREWFRKRRLKVKEENERK
jgi:hypothetical protein